MPSRDEWSLYFADAVRQMREDSGMTVAAMAETMGVDERTYRKYERGIASPAVIDYCCFLDKLDAPVLRPILNFLHPDVFADGDGDLGEIREKLTYYVNNVAPDRILRQTYYNLMGQVADNVAPQLEMISAVQHLPLLYRVMVVKFVLSMYELAEDRGELVHMDEMPPDIAALKQAAEQAEAACKQMREGYKTITAEP